MGDDDRSVLSRVASSVYGDSASFFSQNTRNGSSIISYRVLCHRQEQRKKTMMKGKDIFNYDYEINKEEGYSSSSSLQY
jgi:hypothetical protein